MLKAVARTHAASSTRPCFTFLGPLLAARLPLRRRNRLLLRLHLLLPLAALRLVPRLARLGTRIAELVLLRLFLLLETRLVGLAHLVAARLDRHRVLLPLQAAHIVPHEAHAPPNLAPLDRLQPLLLGGLNLLALLDQVEALGLELVPLVHPERVAQRVHHHVGLHAEGREENLRVAVVHALELLEVDLAVVVRVQLVDRQPQVGRQRVLVQHLHERVQLVLLDVPVLVAVKDVEAELEDVLLAEHAVRRNSLHELAEIELALVLHLY
mmetsp:Transcript_9244/g.32580  ORF Transcript_9244/g.32580 Transcript_9244/m.32580 type:complete len:268 (+) Transcript_9244:240-1043(+)